MAFKLTMDTDNAAFCDPDGHADEFAQASEIARVLRNVAGDVEDGVGSSGMAFDINGNRVCEWEITE